MKHWPLIIEWMLCLITKILELLNVYYELGISHYLSDCLTLFFHLYSQSLPWLVWLFTLCCEATTDFDIVILQFILLQRIFSNVYQYAFCMKSTLLYLKLYFSSVNRFCVNIQIMYSRTFYTAWYVWVSCRFNGRYCMTCILIP
jgi:hypothetical protein